jgi:hypothetical protein
MFMSARTAWGGGGKLGNLPQAPAYNRIFLPNIYFNLAGFL